MSIMMTETIDKLFLELSQVTTAVTERELRLLGLLRQALYEMPLARHRSQRQRALCKEIEAALVERGMLEVTVVANTKATEGT